MEVVIESVFRYKNGDVMQIMEDDVWTDMGIITDHRAAAVDHARNDFKVFGKPVRVVRRDNLKSIEDLNKWTVLTDK